MTATDRRFIELLNAAGALVPHITAFQPAIEESRCIPTALVGKLREGMPSLALTLARNCP